MSAALLAVLAAAWKPLAALGAGAFVILMAVLKGKASAERDQARAETRKSEEMRVSARAWIVAATLSLTACATGSSKVCPSHITYSPEAQARAADELAALPAESELVRLIGDYAAVRAEIRACRAG